MSVSVKFAWYDLWVGAFIERNHPDYRLVVYVCPLPTLLFVLRFGVVIRDANGHAWGCPAYNQPTFTTCTCGTLDNISPRYRPMTTGGLPDEAFWPDDASDGLSNDVPARNSHSDGVAAGAAAVSDREAAIREEIHALVPSDAHQPGE